MKSYLVVIAIFAATVNPGAYAKAPVYASEACNAGCFNKRGPATIYDGAVPATYRVCAASFLPASLDLDGKAIEVRNDVFNSRSCTDLNGYLIRLVSGVVDAGALP
jgi:hypothetical protein